MSTTTFLYHNVVTYACVKSIGNLLPTCDRKQCVTLITLDQKLGVSMEVACVHVDTRVST